MYLAHSTFTIRTQENFTKNVFFFSEKASGSNDSRQAYRKLDPIDQKKKKSSTLKAGTSPQCIHI